MNAKTLLFLTHLGQLCIYSAETIIQRVMKYSRLTRFVGALCVALMCFALSSCSERTDGNPYSATLWQGFYPVQTENNDTGEREDHTAYVELQFSKSGMECTVARYIVGLDSMSLTKYAVEWYSSVRFVLYESQAGQTIQYYSGTINGNKMSFEFLSCDKVERTIELERLDLMLE